MEHLDKTVLFQKTELGRKDVKEVLGQVYDALEEKGYNSISQIVGYLLSGDPAYIPRHNDARNLIRRFECDEIMEELVRQYLTVAGKKLQ